MNIENNELLTLLENAYIDYKNTKENSNDLELIARKRGICNGIEMIIFNYAKDLTKEVLVLRAKIFNDQSYLDIPTIIRKKTIDTFC